MCLEGNGRAGCYLIGSDQEGSAGFAVLDSVDLRSADILVYFEAPWEHPLLLSYDKVYGQHFRTAGIVLGGIAGAARSGESAWNFGTTVMTNARRSGDPPRNGHVVNRTSPTFDLISWRDLEKPLFGWLVMRSKDGKSGWHVPPNWRASIHTGTDFKADKGIGEVWQYCVVRQTVGISLRRAKAVAAAVLQAEYCGIGIRLEGVIGFSFQAIYYENRDRWPEPLPAYAAMLATRSFGEIGTGWIEKASYGLVVEGRSGVEVGTLLGNDLTNGLSSANLAGTLTIRRAIRGTSPRKQNNERS
ncbi:hypothetical protein LQ954_12565 [Sphingomonas sp. IC-11]|uniref:hypothetical protein n=1 Tax=Sphingomonas sp. IC-11 TaxID=2898528 RepID=UPI001E2B3F6A|nr:hypothetical protein [Sphingomonas sp. IC-11]MCD2316981.1 hypothetical protein [Sphingomonas sp. IC-11]